MTSVKMLTVNEVLSLPIVQAQKPKCSALTALPPNCAGCTLPNPAKTSHYCSAESWCSHHPAQRERRPRIYHRPAHRRRIRVIIENTSGSNFSVADSGLPVIVLRRQTRGHHRGHPPTLVAHCLKPCNFLAPCTKSTPSSHSKSGRSAIITRTAALLDAPVVLEDVRHRVLRTPARNLMTGSTAQICRLPEHTGRSTGAENWLQTWWGRPADVGRLIVPNELADDERAAPWSLSVPGRR